VGEKELTLGSLFDGIGGFPLAAMKNGITPVWASEIDAVPISITKRHFPDMVHLGDVTKINGGEIEPVDIITFGSPCQDLSTAGISAGLDGSRSNTFFDAIRIIKQMRKKTNGKYPTRIIWENVPGAFSSNEGRDFNTVLQEIASIAWGGALSIPRPAAREGDTVWEPAGAIVGDGWSLAWRILDAQYWGVPQRRRRVFVIADFGSECVREILFKPEGLSWNSTEGGTQRKGNSRNLEGCINAAGIIDDQGGNNIHAGDADVAPCLRSETHGNLPIVAIPINTQIASRHNVIENRTGLGIGKDGDPAFTLQENHHHAVCVENHPNDSRIKINDDGVVQTLSSRMETGGGNVPLIFEPGIASRDGGHIWQNDIAPSLRACPGDNLPAVCLPVYCIQGNTIDRSDNAGANGKGINEDLSFTLNTIDRHAVAFSMQGFADYKESEKASSIRSRDYKDSTDLITSGFAVRRLTPTECERLQGFPDGWTALGHDNKKISDSARYKALGNSVALPCIDFLMSRIREAV
jgi:DNA (cytosine-5)-methyltransferase 1